MPDVVLHSEISKVQGGTHGVGEGQKRSEPEVTMVEDSALADGRVLTWVYCLDLLLHELQAPSQPRQSHLRFLVAVQNPGIFRNRHTSHSILQPTRLQHPPLCRPQT